MILYPAIDLIAGRCVRLAQGDFARETQYDEEPAAALDRFADEGATWAHIVDLDGAKAREPRQHALLTNLAHSARLKLQVAGGVRSPKHVATLLDAGVSRVVVGSLAVNNPPAFAALLDKFGPERLTLALDVRIEHEIIERGAAMVATHGWAEGSGQSLDQVLDQFPTVRHLLVTDIGRDGMLTGINIEATVKLAQALTIPVIASGGLSNIADIERLCAVEDQGIEGVICGRAIYSGGLDFALAQARADELKTLG